VVLKNKNDAVNVVCRAVNQLVRFLFGCGSVPGELMVLDVLEHTNSPFVNRKFHKYKTAMST